MTKTNNMSLAQVNEVKIMVANVIGLTNCAAQIGAKCAAQPFPANAQLLWLAAANAGSHYGYFEFPFPLKTSTVI